MRFILFCLLSGFSTISLWSQDTLNFNGKVTDQSGNTIDLALINLISSKDSSLINSVFSDQDGSFAIKNLPEGFYQAEISFIGFETLKKSIQIVAGHTPDKVEIFVLKPVSSLLDVVTVTGKTSFIERKTDRIIIHPEVMISNSGGNVLDALERVPGIVVDPSSGLSLKARNGVVVFLDDKPLYLSGTDLLNYLASLPVSSVKSIEIMSNPPAKYDAAGNAGVVNIVTKRNEAAGFFGNLSLSLQQGRYTRSNNNFNIFYNKKKWSTYLNLSGGVRNSFQDLNINRYYRNAFLVNTSSFSQNSFIEKTGQSLNGKWGMDYYLTKKMTIGLSLRGLSNPNGDHTINQAFIRNEKKEIRNRVFADNTTKNTFQNLASNVYFKYNMEELQANFLIDGDYVTYRANSEQTFNNHIFSDAEIPVYSDVIRGKIPSDIRIVTGRLQYEKSWKDKSSWEIGIKTANTTTENIAEYTKTIGSITFQDTDLSNQFIYKEWIHAAFTNFNKKFGVWETQIGLRAETTSFDGFQPGNSNNPDTSFTRIYHNLFPTLFLSTPLDTSGIHILQFSFGRRIDRPFFQDLNPFVSPLDKYTFYAGNPDLRPTYSNNFSMTYSYQNKVNTTLSYGFVSDGINETLEIRDSIYYSRPGNISDNHAISLSADVALNIGTWYRLNAYGEIGYLIYQSKLYTENLDASGEYFSVNATQTFIAKQGWTFECRGEYRSDVIYSQLLVKGFGIVNIGVGKKLFRDAGNVRLLVSDLFYTRRADGVINNLRNTDADWNSRLDTRSVTMTFSYRFGKATAQKSRPQSSSSESEQKRVKS